MANIYILFFLSLLLACTSVAGFLGYPQPDGGAHPPIPREGGLGDELGDWASWL